MLVSWQRISEAAGPSQVGHLRDFYTTPRHKSTEAFSLGAGTKAALKTCHKNRCVSDPWVERKCACFKVKTSFFSFHQWKVSGRSGRSGIPSLPPVWTRPRQCILWGHRLWWAGSGDVGKPGRFASPTNYQAAWALRKVQRMFIAQFVHLGHVFSALWIAHTAFQGFVGQIQGEI